jgi:hypothetical protein
MMTFFYVLVVVTVGALLLSPLLYIKKTWLKVVVTLIALGCAGATIPLSQNLLYPEYYAWKVEKEIKKQPLFHIIAERHPKEFAAFISDVKKSYQKTHSSVLMPALAAQLVNRIFIQYLQKAPDDYITLYLKATTTLYEYLNKQDPQAVLNFEQGSSLIFSDQMKSLAQDPEFQKLLNRVLEAKRYLIEATIKSPMPIPTEQEAKPLLNAVLQKLTDSYGDQAVSIMFEKVKPDTSPEMVSKLIIAFYTEIQAAGEAQAGIMMRYLAVLKGQSLEKKQFDSKKE